MKTKYIAILSIAGVSLGFQVGLAGHLSKDGSCSDMKVSHSSYRDTTRVGSDRTPRQGLGAQDLTGNQSATYNEYGRMHDDMQSRYVGNWNEINTPAGSDIMVSDPAGTQRRTVLWHNTDFGSAESYQKSLCDRRPQQGQGAKDLVKGIQLNRRDSDQFHNHLDDENSKF